nr:chemotaxis protein CheW [uncultured Duganella sp.]
MRGPTPDTETPAAPDGTERRSRLRQYQVRLLERVQAAKSGAAVGGRELGVLIGGRLCLLELTRIGEIVPRQPVTPVPLTRDWYLGLANIRGDLTGIVDLARYPDWDGGDGVAGGGGARAAASERRFITFAPALGFHCALLAERVLGLRKLADMRPAPDGGEGAGDGEAGAVPIWRGARLADADGQSWTRIDLARLVRDPAFLHVGL